MATATLRLSCAINEDGNAQNPAAGVEMQLNNPDGTVHTAFAAATQDVGVGTGVYSIEFTIDDTTDAAGVYMLFYKTTTDGGKTPIGCYPVTVSI